METLLQDLRYALRALARNPVFSCVAVLTLGIGIGATTAIFSVADHVVFRDLPYDAAGRVVTLWETDRVTGEQSREVSPGNFHEWQARVTSLEAIGLAEPSGVDLTGDGPPASVPTWDVTRDFFRAIGARPVLGPGFGPEHYEDGGPAAVMISWDLWQRRYGGLPSLVGDRIEVNGAPATVVGILPPWLEYPEPKDIWTPKRLRPDEAEARQNSYMHAVGRLAPGRTLAEAQAELDAVAAALGREFARTNENSGVRLEPLADSVVGTAREALFVLLGAVGFLLLTACANVTHLVLARAADRGHELSVRASLGANRLRLGRQLMTESLLLACLGGILGIGLAAAGIEVLAAVSPPGLPRIETVAVDVRILAFAVAVTAATALLFGLVPAFRLSRADARGAQRIEPGQAGSAAQGTVARNALVVAEIAIAMVLLVGAGLLTRSFAALLDNPLGFAPERRATIQLFIWDRNPDAAARIVRVAAIDERLEAVPGVESVAVVSAVPFHPTRIFSRAAVTVAGESPEAGGSEVTVHSASADYFTTMGMRLLRGDTWEETGPGGDASFAVINETLARSRFGDRDPVGRRLVLESGATVEVAGVVGDVRTTGFGSEPEPELYLPYDRSGTGNVTFVVRTEGDPAAVMPSLRSALWQVDPAQSIYHEATLAELVRSTLAERRFHLLLIGAFAAVALVLCTIGVFGVTSFATSRRSREIGIRMAVGAHARDVLGMVLRQGVSLAVAGVAAGAFAAFLLTRLLGGMLYEVSATDPVTFVVTALLLVGAAQLASLIPARRAARFDPMTALRTE